MFHLPSDEKREIEDDEPYFQYIHTFIECTHLKIRSQY